MSQAYENITPKGFQIKKLCKPICFNLFETKHGPKPMFNESKILKKEFKWDLK